MKRLLKHYKQYSICYIMSIVVIIGLFVSNCLPELLVIGTDKLPFEFDSIYLLFIIPIFSIIYGCTAYAKIRKIWLPQIIYLVMFILGYLLLTFLLNGSFEKTKGILILCIYPVAFSLFGTIVTAFIFKIKETIEK